MSSNFDPQEDQFRDEIATVTKEGKRIKVYPKKPKGKFYSARNYFSLLLLAILFVTPFIKVNGRPFMLFDIINRKFILFSIPFGPHDFHLFALTFIGIIVAIFLFTVVYGRLFCGWVCPQTIFMEMVFRKIEYWIEGDAHKQRALNRAEWTGKKIFKKSLKQIIFFSLSFIISNFFLSYIIGMDELITIVTAPPSEHLTGLSTILIFSGIFYFVFSYFREQACTLVCPYGRLQGVMLDQNSIVIAYDHPRGEPRAKGKRDKESQLGDCVDCHQCVDVCPTGIDIRNGTQLECVNCTACIDACDSIMEKVNLPKGLIRYASKNEIENKVRKTFTPRAISYTVFLVLLFSLITVLLANRSDFELSILRTPGMIYQQQADGKISNLYDFTLINKTFTEYNAKLELQNIDGEIKMVGTDLIMKPQGVIEAKFLVLLDETDLKVLNTKIEIAVTANDKIIDVIKTNFLGKVEKRKK